jgi:Two component regulator propeller.
VDRSYFGGLNYYPKGYSYFEKYYPKKEDNFRLGKRVREFCQGKDGTIWIGTEDKGLFLFDPQNGKIQPFVDKLLYNNVHGLCMDGIFCGWAPFPRDSTALIYAPEELRTIRRE